MSREMDTVLFMGMGARSRWMSNRLRHRLDHILGDLSGAQQAGGMGGTQEESDLAVAEYNENAEDFVRDLAAALLGRSVELGEKLPYPGKSLRQLIPPEISGDLESPQYCRACGRVANYSKCAEGTPCVCGGVVKEAQFCKSCGLARNEAAAYLYDYDVAICPHRSHSWWEGKGINVAR